MSSSSAVEENDSNRESDEVDHPESLRLYIQQLYLDGSGKLADVTVNCAGDYIGMAHRVVLAAFSTHFEAALTDVDGSVDLTLDIDPRITGVNANNLKRILDFIYTGRASREDNLHESAQALGCVSLALLLDSEEAHEPGTIVEDGMHAQRLMEALYRYRIEQRLTDVTISCQLQGQTVTVCHRIVLCAFSGHFEQSLESTMNSPFITLDVDTSVTGITATDLKAVVDFMYMGVLRAPKRRHKNLMTAAKALTVNKLLDYLQAATFGGPIAADQSAVHRTAADDGASTSSAGHSLGGRAIAKLEPGTQHGANFDVGATQDIGGISYHNESHQNPAFGVASSSSSGNVNNNNISSTSAYISSNRNESNDFIGAEETMGRELTAADDYVDIYEQYVAGPRRGKRGGTYGRRPDPFQIKGPAVPMDVDKSAMYLFGSGGLLDDHQQSGPSSSTNGDSNWPLMEGDKRLNALTVSFLPSARRHRMVDSFGYGLPEIVGTNDVTVPLLVGDQKTMMEKPFKCPYCDHRTKEKSAVEKHIRCIHTLEAPYKCRYCSQAFKVQSNLVRHIRAHTGEKPYVCKKCGTAYADKKNMDAHVFREHLKIKPLECPETGCSAKFWRQDRFVYHCRRIHDFEPDFQSNDHQDGTSSPMMTHATSDNTVPSALL